jgi:hypothetical protein
MPDKHCRTCACDKLPKAYSVCQHDGEPLVTHIACPGFEWICVVCGQHYRMFGVGSKPATEELHDRYAELFAIRKAAIIAGGDSCIGSRR